MEEKFLLNKIWSNPNRLWVLICTHGDETLWFNVMKMIENVVDDLTFVLMNKRAFDIWKRYVEYDLNRCFLWNILEKWLDSYEYKLSQELHEILTWFDNIIDIHSTNFDIDPYFIIDTLEKKESILIKSASNELIKNSYLIPLSKWTVIWPYLNAIAIESWPNNDKKKIHQVANIVKNISNNIWFNHNNEKELNVFWWELTKKDVFRLREDIKDFDLIAKWAILWYNEEWKIVIANEDMKLFWINNKFEDPNVLAIKLKI
ncbi:MAG: hypothetical protein ACD_80C00011G0004 [uncultured bacterium (gcode 4)]|uniref:Succinylglutamate desuccinylase/Aspartoacylase catalytic domain-containing protein n=1 Tax=uncultured bacterium (gcode 4) TaxID=1234023 RepID=K1XKH0_9BACT|nr:MAG: hypothetical protein ACD_80C00011G0004 [uncultured bacterium (gcode 4)]